MCVLDHSLAMSVLMLVIASMENVIVMRALKDTIAKLEVSIIPIYSSVKILKYIEIKQNVKLGRLLRHMGTFLFLGFASDEKPHAPKCLPGLG
jgi:hypothetical protein